MGNIVKTGIHLNKVNSDKSKFLEKTTSNILFAHKLRAGETSIDLSNLNTPTTEMPGFIQPSMNILASMKMLLNKNNLSIFSLTKGQLIQYADYKITGDLFIEFSSSFISHLETDEVFVCQMIASPTGDFNPASTKSVKKTYTLLSGQNTLNLGIDYSVNQNPLDNIGIISVFKNGVLAFRNTGNVASGDKDYYEPDSGNGKSSTIIFNTPAVADTTVMVDFGVMAVTGSDQSSLMQYLAGSIQQLSTDLAPLSGKTPSDYYVASPTEINTREYGDTVLMLLKALLPVGSIIHSVLTEAQFQNIVGNGWVLYDDRDITGSKLHQLTGFTNLHDARGLTLRGKNNSRSDGKQNPGGDLGIGEYQADAFQGHSHSMPRYAGNHTLNTTYMATGTSQNGTVDTGSSGVTTLPPYGSPRVAEETRGKSLTVNIFIKIN